MCIKSRLPQLMFACFSLPCYLVVDSSMSKQHTNKAERRDTQTRKRKKTETVCVQKSKAVQIDSQFPPLLGTYIVTVCSTIYALLT